LARAAHKLEYEALSDTTVSRAQAIVLLAVGGMGQPAMSMLARRLQLAPSTLTHMVDPLVERGLLRRDASPDDRRVVVVTLTAQGKRALRKVEAELDRAYARVAAFLSAGDQAKLLRALDELIEALERERLTGG
jgi:DNA-binding MarR family transcriptional regulator